jgi:DNA-binding GntR family transcriptional regulator
MRTRTVIGLLLVIVTPAIAGNARSDRAAMHYQREVYRRAVRDYQWQQHMQWLRRDQQRAAQNPYTDDSMRARLWQRNQRWRSHWQQERRRFQQTPNRPYGWR